ncbi:GDP-mannose 4,6-dehydratase [Campylobacter fetus]|uniref:GDP-mannose 4,6-dehydratase n=1 Tax=Campylobacter fetus TaxID=196 RepID=A0A5L4L7C4_CAMFE|nr:GDP-mannose 4,6-dehydratase [Campylobacter fetus]HDX6330818.1 GDP-mannose 4,6-dehydratase [Campylobacter fetus subsp. venerealis]EAI4415548.1 GDP-mannose 4,6-dehydratase [Campylobacter fetus]EAI5408714.1 GDP-mannose 4,6-dehydratase [Campylobacter fetus]EAJ0328275.1 GDP-mannose 4,6-dehydratase [Campylobacter fetus]EAJ1231017.1 GDP-mannose 4,6-dehydratase [Campylobacter fetus]
MKTVLITGVTGQDGAYLSRYLLDLGYKVYGGFRRAASTNLWRLNELNLTNEPQFSLIELDITDPVSCINAIKTSKPDEIYNLAAQSFVGISFNEPLHTSYASGIAVLNLLEAIRLTNKSIKFYQAGTSEMFGKVQTIPQTEKTPFYPRSPYGVAKLYGHFMTINYRESYDIFASCGILFNHESPLRGLEFVTRKITNTAAKIALKKVDCLELGNLDAKRDWGYAKDYVEGMYAILQHTNADTFVLASNKTTTVRDFVKMSFEALDIPLTFEGSGENEVARDKQGNILVKVNPKFFRPAEVDLLIGDASKAKTALNWQAKTNLDELCSMMVKADLKRIQNGFEF